MSGCAVYVVVLVLALALDLALALVFVLVFVLVSVVHVCVVLSFVWDEVVYNTGPCFGVAA